MRTSPATSIRLLITSAGDKPCQSASLIGCPTGPVTLSSTVVTKSSKNESVSPIAKVLVPRMVGPRTSFQSGGCGCMGLGARTIKGRRRSQATAPWAMTAVMSTTTGGGKPCSRVTSRKLSLATKPRVGGSPAAAATTKAAATVKLREIRRRPPTASRVRF